MTLIEMLIAILVGGAILASTASLVSKVIAANSAAAHHLHSTQAIGELGRQFRDDIHRAKTIAINQGESPRLTLELVVSVCACAKTGSTSQQLQAITSRRQRRKSNQLGLGLGTDLGRYHWHRTLAEALKTEGPRGTGMRRECGVTRAITQSTRAIAALSRPRGARTSQ